MYCITILFFLERFLTEQSFLQNGTVSQKVTGLTCIFLLMSAAYFDSATASATTSLSAAIVVQSNLLKQLFFYKTRTFSATFQRRFKTEREVGNGVLPYLCEFDVDFDDKRPK